MMKINPEQKINVVRHAGIFPITQMRQTAVPINIIGSGKLASACLEMVWDLGYLNVHIHEFGKTKSEIEPIFQKLSQFALEDANLEITCHYHNEMVIPDDDLDGIVFLCEENLERQQYILQNVLFDSFNDLQIFFGRWMNSTEVYAFDFNKFDCNNTRVHMANSSHLKTVWATNPVNLLTIKMLLLPIMDAFKVAMQVSYHIYPMRKRNRINKINYRYVPNPDNPAIASFKKDWECTVIGQGMTGSEYTLLKDDAYFRTLGIDYDEVKDVNISNQLFRMNQIGEFKTKAMSALLSDRYRYETIEVTDQAHLMGEVVALLTDTMTSRKEIFWKCIKDNPKCKVLVETRMGAENIRVYTVFLDDPESVSSWLNTLVDDNVTAENLCGTKVSIVNTGTLCACFGHRNTLWALEDLANGTRTVPFVTEIFTYSDNGGYTFFE